MGLANFDCHLKFGEVGRVGQFSLLWRSRIPQKGNLTCKERGIFPKMLLHYGLPSGFPYYGLTTLECQGYPIPSPGTHNPVALWADTKDYPRTL